MGMTAKALKWERNFIANGGDHVLYHPHPSVRMAYDSAEGVDLRPHMADRIVEAAKRGGYSNATLKKLRAVLAYDDVDNRRELMEAQRQEHAELARSSGLDPEVIEELMQLICDELSPVLMEQLEAILSGEQVAGDEPPDTRGGQERRHAMDSAAAKSFHERFPAAAKIGRSF